MKVLIASLIVGVSLYAHSGGTNADGCHNYKEGGYHCHITKKTIDNLSAGWHMLGTSMELDDLTIFDAAVSVWKWNGTEWEAYSSDEKITLELEDKGIAPLETIEPNGGFWVLIK